MERGVGGGIPVLISPPGGHAEHDRAAVRFEKLDQVTALIERVFPFVIEPDSPDRDGWLSLMMEVGGAVPICIFFRSILQSSETTVVAPSPSPLRSYMTA